MNECYTTVCLVLRSWNPVCLTNDFPGNLLMQKVLICLAKKIGKGGGGLRMLRRYWFFISTTEADNHKGKNCQEWMSTTERIMEEKSVVLFRHLGFESWIVWFLHEEGSLIFILSLALFFLLKVFGVFRSKWGRISWMHLLRGKKLNCDGILLFL